MSDTITLPREVVEEALEALGFWDEFRWGNDKGAVAALRTALAAEPTKVALTTKEITMPITDDNGKPLRPQYRVIEQIGNWYLLYDQHQSGEAVRHEFRIQKLRHDIALYPGISLAEAQKRFRELVEADNE